MDSHPDGENPNIVAGGTVLKVLKALGLKFTPQVA
jgi:DNA-binding phage protein